MIIDLSSVTFTNDLFQTSLPDGSTMYIYRLNEDFITEEGTECEVKSLTIEVYDENDTMASCPCIIGMSNDLMEIQTDYTEYEGEVLTEDNMQYCTIEVYE